MNDRFERQRGLIPADQMSLVTATVIGVGAIGRAIGLQLAAIGVRRIQLIDFDRVEAINITTQGFSASDIGRPKVDALSAAISAVDPSVLVEAIEDRFRPKQSIGDAVFCAVDSISSRAAIWRSAEHRCRFWVDSRMLGESIRILTASDEESRNHYKSTLFAQSEAQSGNCTTRAVIYAASFAAAVAVHQLTRWIRALPLDRDSSINLLASEWSVVA